MHVCGEDDQLGREIRRSAYRLRRMVYTEKLYQEPMITACYDLEIVGESGEVLETEHKAFKFGSSRQIFLMHPRSRSCASDNLKPHATAFRTTTSFQWLPRATPSIHIIVASTLTHKNFPPNSEWNLYYCNSYAWT